MIAVKSALGLKVNQLKFYKTHLRGLSHNGEVWDMIVVDGVVGVGKTTLMGILADELGMVAHEEPVANNPILDKFYDNREKYSFALQIFFLNERFRHIKLASKENGAVLDRSIYGDLIFAKLLRDNGEMSCEEFNIYLDLFHNMIEHCHPPKLMVYLEISPEEAMKRIEKRGRPFEQHVEKKYWLNLNKNYREFFHQYNFSPVIRIDVDHLDFENNKSDKQHVLDLIRAELDS